MASKIKVDQIEGSTASTITLPSGQTLDLSSGSITLPDSAVDLSSAKVTGTLGSSSLPTVPVTKGGTGLTSLGTANQVVAVNSGASALEFQDASSGGVKQLKRTIKTDVFTSSSSSFVDVTGLSVSITPSSTSSRILVMANPSLNSENQSGGLLFYKIVRQIGSGSFTDINVNTVSGTHGHAEHEANSVDAHIGVIPLNLMIFDHPNTTSQVTYKFQCKTNGSNTVVCGRSGRADSNSSDLNYCTEFLAIEIDGGIL